MTSASSSVRVGRSARRRFAIDRATVIAALFFLVVFAAEMALILHGASEIDPASLMGFVT